MNRSAYIETTIFGYLMSRSPKDPVVAGQMVATRQWWDQSRQYFDLFTSQFVIDEISKGDPQAAAERLDAASHMALICTPFELPEVLS